MASHQQPGLMQHLGEESGRGEDRGCGPGRILPWRLAGRLIVCGCAVALLLAVGYYLIRRHVRASASITVQQAEQALRRRDNAQARETLKWLLWFEPAENRALLIAGISLNADRRFPEAVEVLDRISESSESFEQGGIALGASLIHDGQWERAESVLKRQLARFPESGDAHERLVRLYLQELRQREAVALLVDRRRRRPDDLSVLPHLLELAVKNVTPQDRLGALETADDKHPRQAPVVLALARAYSLMGMTQQAQDRFQSALELGPYDPVTRILAAEFHLDCGELDAARSLLRPEGPLTTEVFTDAFNDDRYWFVRCRIAEQSEEAGEAYAHLQKALALRPQEETYLLMQAGLLRQLGRADEAAQAASRAAQLAEDRKHLMILWENLNHDRPDSTHCLAIAELLESMGEPQQAADWRRVSRAVAPLESAGEFPPRVRTSPGTLENHAP